MVCPRCGTKQSAAPDCVNCGVIVQTYLHRKKKNPDVPAEIPFEHNAFRRPTLIRQMLRTTVILVIGMVGFAVVLLTRPTGPQKLGLISLANSMMQTVESINSVVSSIEEFQVVTAGGYGLTDGALSSQQLQRLIQHEKISRKGKPSAVQVAQEAIEKSGIIPDTQQANEHITAELQYLQSTIAAGDPVLGKILPGLQELQRMQKEFCRYAFSPEKQGFLVRYHLGYRVNLAYFMSAYKNYIDAVSLIHSNKQKALSREELDRAHGFLASYRASPLYMGMSE